ncbi:S-adenosyl-L-methionine-dependent methyltransferase [Chaetomium sp. MPI-SDFR-AT-0129]|nr:S-adenosyl-L-methionine-dependent methyltransferase [Chaetomium sp. MPI-SDFR-AT-0129]
MSTQPTPQPPLGPEAIASWDVNAAYWDASITKDGNKYWRRLQEPCLARFLEPFLPSGGRVLDLATGNGLCARWLADKLQESGGEPGEVVATDASEGMLGVARGYGNRDGRITFRRVDVTSGEELKGLREEKGRFGVVLMNMAIMDVAELEPLAKALRELLVPGGVFVATLLHPVFFTSNASRIVEVSYNPMTGDQEIVRGKLVKEYMSVPPAKGIAIPGQPTKQLYFHRPIQDVFLPFFKAGLVMDAMEELAFTDEAAEPDRVESTANYTQLPAILAFRMRLPKS